MRITGYKSHGVGAATALVNAVTVAGEDDGDERLRAILGEHGFFVQRFTPATAAALRPWARRLRGLYEAATLDEAVTLFNRLLTDEPMHPHLADHDELGLHIHYAPPDVDLAHRFRATSLMNLAELLCDHGIERIGVCAAACDRVYADDSRGGRRRFCSDACANRTNVAAFRARRRRRGTGDTSGMASGTH